MPSHSRPKRPDGYKSYMVAKVTWLPNSEREFAGAALEFSSRPARGCFKRNIVTTRMNIDLCCNGRVTSAVTRRNSRNKRGRGCRVEQKVTEKTKGLSEQ